MMGTADENEAEKIGILADSHGQVDALRAGVSALMERDCSILYHLGDICDSAFPEKTAACLEIIKHHQVRAVKGNNEHTVSVNYIDREDGAVPQSAALFMGRLPLVRSLPGAVFCHSLPFESELGLSAMVRVMDAPSARHFSQRYPTHVLFRGHSHTPEIIYFSRGRVVFDAFPADRRISLSRYRPCVVTCGALTDGLFMIWDRKKDLIVSLGF